MKNYLFGHDRILQIEVADITAQEVDAIVNPANGFLRHGGGVAGAIIRVGGRAIQHESDLYVRTYGPLEVSQVAVTGAGTLKAKNIIHVFGPQYGEDDIEEKLYQSFKNVLYKAGELGFETLATPAISTGIFGIPVTQCAREFFKSVIDYFRDKQESPLRLIKMCLLDRKSYETFYELSLDYFSSTE